MAGDATVERPPELFQVGPCEGARQLGYLIGQSSAHLIQSRLAKDPVLNTQLRPFAQTPKAQPLLKALFDTNKKRFPRYWEELMGIAAGGAVPPLDILLLNFRKEIIPFVPKEEAGEEEDSVENSAEDCCDLLLLNDLVASIAHNEDANAALVGHTFLVEVSMPDGLSFTAYTYAGELPSSAFGFNSHGVGFTLNAVPPMEEEILKGGIGRNFVSRDLLEANSLTDALERINRCNVSVGHNYNLFDVNSREISNVETASGGRMSVQKIGVVPFFHANRYLHLHVSQEHSEFSIARERRATMLPTNTEDEILCLLGDSDNKEFPIYSTGPKLHTLCTAIFDLDKRTLTIIQGNPKKGNVSHRLKIP